MSSWARVWCWVGSLSDERSPSISMRSPSASLRRRVSPDVAAAERARSGEPRRNGPGRREAGERNVASREGRGEYAQRTLEVGQARESAPSVRRSFVNCAGPPPRSPPCVPTFGACTSRARTPSGDDGSRGQTAQPSETAAIAL
jgi:hypothetical protein